MTKLNKRKCKQCGEVFQKTKSLQYICSVGCSISYAKIQEEKKRLKESKENTKKMKESLKTKQDYEKELQVVVNTYVRLRDQNRLCISCDNTLIGKFDAGHFYPAGSYKNIRFDLDNIHGQCVACNQHRHGNLLEYRPKLIIRIGIDRFTRLEESRLQPRKYTIPELIIMKENYKEKIKKLKL